MSKKLFVVFAALSLVVSACGFRVDVPQAKTVGPEVTEAISATYPKGEARLVLKFGAGELEIMSGAGSKLVEGTATFNVADFAPTVVTEGSEVRVEQGEYVVNAVPDLSGLKNEWVLKLGEKPLALAIEAGAYEGRFDFGGLALTDLSIRDGAADVELDFSQPNEEKMGVFEYTTGASNVTVFNLANANASTISFEGGAGNYTLDFGGELQRDASVTIRAGVSNITLVIPEGIAAQIRVNGGLSNITASGWEQNGDTYTRAGEGPKLVILVDIGAGNLLIR